MLDSKSIATRLIEIIDQHQLWDEVAQYGNGMGRDFLENVINSNAANGAPFTVSELLDFCTGAAIPMQALVVGEEVVPAPTAWQRQLARYGVQHHLAYRRPKDDPEAPVWIDKVKLELEPEEWCSMCMFEGSHYIGPCCGNTAVQQDIVNDVFRESG